MNCYALNSWYCLLSIIICLFPFHKNIVVFLFIRLQNTQIYHIINVYRLRWTRNNGVRWSTCNGPCIARKRFHSDTKSRNVHVSCCENFRYDIHPPQFLLFTATFMLSLYSMTFSGSSMFGRRMPFLILIQIIKWITNELQMLFYSLLCEGSLRSDCCSLQHSHLYCVGSNPFLGEW